MQKDHKEKIRVYQLARELGMESKDLLDACRQAGLDVKNQLSSIDPEQRDAIVQLVKKGGGTATAAPPKPAGSLPAPHAPIPNLTPSRPPVLTRTARSTAAHAAPLAPPPTPEAPPAPVTPPAPAAKAPEQAPPAPPAPAVPAAKAPEAPVRPPEKAAPPQAPAARAPETPAPRPPEQPPAHRPAATAPPTPPPVAPTPPLPGTVSPLGGGQMRNLNAPRSDAGARRTRDRQPPRPSANFRIAAPPPLKARPPEEKKPPQQPTGPKKLAEIPKDLQNRGDVPLKIEDILRQPTKPLAPPVPVVTDEEEEDERNKGKKRPGGVVGRDARHKERNARQAKRKEAAGTEERGGRLTALIEDERPERVKKLTRIRKKAGPQPRKGKVPIDLPITVRSLSEAIGMPKGELLFKLMGQGVANVNINSTLDPDLAEAIALEKGCELDVKRKADVEEQILSDLKKEDRPEDLVPRAPIVTIMGHVDHGKTSLLDKIRQSNVVATEAGGITQVIRAWRVEHGGRPITFLDTPGHEAFTKMRARGANVTDVAVIVVAADDGVMPQTEEAINHAKAAGVSIVVAINKVDLPSANVRRTEQQLYGLGLIPDTMGGDTPFVQTSAASGKGIDQLLDMLSLVAELKELKANPNKPGQGTCLEANLTEGEGVFATLLVQSGTLRRGDVVVCGPAYGRVRALYNDLGHPINEAGPSVPVRITGLDEVPNADDAFLVVPELTVAREIAEKHKVQLQEASVTHRAPISLETLKEVKIAELKVILKADFRGSVEAIRKELEKLQHEEVRVRVLHTGIGAITESDVQLALTSPQDTLILGFNVVPDDRAKSLAEERGVQIKQYNIIYQLTDDVRSALEGKLKPREEIIHLGRAVVRQVFKISRVGAVAGCYVTQGTIERSAKVRVIRNGVVVYPPPDRTVGLESLKRHKDDVREVREGYDCGLKIAGYDDVKVDDVIEAYRVEQIQRTLS